MRCKDFANAAINRITRAMLRVRLMAQYRLGLLKDYQPNAFDSKGISKKYGRLCSDRYEAISSVLPQAPLSFMDLGCNAGYFTFRFSERGGFGVGIDFGRNEVMACQAIASLHRVHNVVFSRLALNPQNVRTLPSVDIVLFLSLFHHFVRYYGEAAALEMLESIGSKAEKFLVFETGQPNEDATWAGQLSFMGQQPDVWAKRQLVDMGFNKVHDLGLFSTSVSDVQRHLLLAERI